jgi:UPF0755 protein
MKRIGQLFGSLLVVLVLLGAVTTWWVMRPLTLTNPTVDISIEPQTTVRGIAQVVADSGVRVEPFFLYGFFLISGQSRKLRAGSYEISQGESVLDLLRKLSRGEESLKAVGLIDGWTFKQFRAALAKAPNLNHDSQGLSDAELMARLGKPGVAPEGRFFPDTYTYGKGASELRVMQRALNAMDKQLAAAWAQRNTSIILKTPDEALILASIVEKETGKESDRGMISSVFHNRLRINMPLQTDPTVIYGMGDAFDGNLRRADLKSDHAWNTYTRKGLPPTPIAMPGRNALRATLHPNTSNALYFVARGDGTSAFSETLEAHNAAVNRYQRGGASLPSSGAQAK